VCGSAVSNVWQLAIKHDIINILVCIIKKPHHHKHIIYYQQ
jgi:hypothetical protein